MNDTGYYSDWWSLSQELKNYAIAQWGEDSAMGHRYRVENGQLQFRSPLPSDWVDEDPSPLAAIIPAIPKPTTYVNGVSID